MANLIRRGDRHFRRWEPYVGLLLSTGGFTWVAKHLSVFGQLGWAESVFIGVFTSVLIAVGLALYRVWRPLPGTVGMADDLIRQNLGLEPSPALEPAGGDTLVATGTVSDPTPEVALQRLLHVGYILPSVGKLKDGGFIELTVVAYNASPKTLIVSDVRGNAHVTVMDGEQQIKEKVATPDLIRTAPDRKIAPYSEFVLTLHQHVSERISLLIRGAMRKKGTTLDFEGLILEFEPYQEPGPKVRLPLWDGIGISENGVRFSRVIIMRMAEPISLRSKIGDEQ